MIFRETKNLTRMKFVTYSFAFLLLLFGSCSTPLHEVTYLNNIQTDQAHRNGPEPEEYKIRPNDQLFIQVISDDPLNAAFLNLTNTQGNTGNMGSSVNSLELITFLVDEQGNISYPQLGDINVGGLTTAEVSDIIQGKVNQYLESASVFVKLV